MSENIIELKNVSFRYKGSERSLLNNASLSIKKGEVLLLCGASGSGKTTIIRLINGLIPHFYNGEISGKVFTAGHDTQNTELYELAGVVGTVFQNPRSQFFSVDTDGEIVFGAENIGLEPHEIIARKEKIVSEMQIEKLLEKSLFELSGGEKQKIACASVSALFPDIILLDEPSSNLDWSAIENLRESILYWKNEGKTIVISEHRLWFLKGIIDRTIYIENGEIRSEWTGDEFFSFDDKTIEQYMLRPLNVSNDIFTDDGKRGVIEFSDSKSGINLRDFYFTYKRRPYLIRKKKLTQHDYDILDLNIPKLDIPNGCVVAVIGKNGMGKSTFLRCLCGLEKDCTGTVTVNGKTYKGKQLLDICYLVMQDVNHQLFTDSVEAEVLLSMKEENTETSDGILKEMGLSKYKQCHPMALSGGQKQRVAIASAVAANAKIFLFDEPTSGLDYIHMEKVGKLLRTLADKGAAVLVSTHDTELISKCCDYTLCIENGKAAWFERN